MKNPSRFVQVSTSLKSDLNCVERVSNNNATDTLRGIELVSFRVQSNYATH